MNTTNYIANVTSKSGCFSKTSTDLNVIRTWAKAVGNPGDTLTILRSGDALKDARVIVM